MNASESVIKSVQRYLHALSETGLEVSFGVIFGSYAKGTDGPYSDIDLLVVSPEFDEVISRESVKKLWRIAARTESRIEPIPRGHRQWENDTSNAIIEIARIEGQRIPVS